jgi:AAHS family 4-hydroxybenzoate transporter-like MFS transporter
MNAVAAAIYPTSVRSTGVGWALGIGRLGSIIGPMVGGMLIANGLTTDTVFVCASLIAAVACLSVIGLKTKSAELHRELRTV